MSQSNSARSRQQQGNAEQRAAQWNNPPRKILLEDAYIGAPLGLSRQICAFLFSYLRLTVFGCHFFRNFSRLANAHSD